jgi:ATP-dependent RNA helicase DDX18/HAS1
MGKKDRMKKKQKMAGVKESSTKDEPKVNKLDEEEEEEQEHLQETTISKRGVDDSLKQKKRKMDDEEDVKNGTKKSNKEKKKNKKNKKETDGDDDDDDDGGVDGEKEGSEPLEKSNEETEEEKPIPSSTSNVKKDFFSDRTFGSLPLTEATQTALIAMGHETMTKVQAKSIPLLLAGKDLIGAAKTGSGKTLAFLVPIVELLRKAKFQTRNGTGAMILAPTRELAMQIYGVCKELLGDTSTLTYGLIMGGANRKTEAERLRKGVNIIIATPGRLLDHMQNSPGFVIRNLLVFCMDEADRILEQGELLCCIFWL